jgi:hypothetical protein
VGLESGGRQVTALRGPVRNDRVRSAILAGALFASVVAVFAAPRIAQAQDYHRMADERAWFGIPNALNVLSNLPFALVGVLGLAATLSVAPARGAAFDEPWERWPYAALFAGVALTALGSSYYHLAPDNARLVWDRLPMTVGFMGLLTAVIAERLGVPVARRVFLPLLALGAISVAYWAWSEGQDRGDLRLYVLVQFGSLLAVVLLLALYPATRAGSGYLIAGLAAYAAAKGFELADAWIFQFGYIVSGHTLKHLIAAGGVACLLPMLRLRCRADLQGLRRGL